MPSFGRHGRPTMIVMVDAAISSLQNPRVKAAAALRDRRDRDRSGLTIVDGGREALRAIEGGVEIVEAFLCPELLRSADAVGAARRLHDAAVPVFEVTPRVLEKLAFGERADGLVLVVRAPSSDLGRIALPPNPLVAIVEALEKPGNLGAIARSADGAGLDALVAADPLTDLFNPNAVRASLGTIFSVPVAAASTPTVIDWLAEHRIRPVAAVVDAPRLYTDVDLSLPTAIILGAEVEGLSEAWRGIDVTAVRLPMLGAADSLNVSVAAAVLFYEARRQRHGHAPTEARRRPEPPLDSSAQRSGRDA